MQNNPDHITLRWVNRMAQIDKTAWNALALPLKTPLLEWDWLNQMEASGSIAPPNGWHPCHLTLWAGKELIAAAPLYVKTHSEGEFVFDYIWADVAERLGISYYPKMVGMIPVTPVDAYRFLVAPGYDDALICHLMLREIDNFCTRNQLTGCSFLFVDQEWKEQIEDADCIEWVHQGFVWENNGFTTFDDYLKIFNTNQRKNIRKERKAMQKAGIRLEMIPGEKMSRPLISSMFRFYEDTNDQHGPWGCKYLNEAFFEGVCDHFGHRLLFVAAVDEQAPKTPVGMSMLIHKGGQLLGRYWGCDGHLKHLHFNVCYYTPIEWAIENGVTYYNPGMGGEHKVRRGFYSVESLSLHRFYDRRLAQIMRVHIGKINEEEREHIHKMNRQLPFARPN